MHAWHSTWLCSPRTPLSAWHGVRGRSSGAGFDGSLSLSCAPQPPCSACGRSTTPPSSPWSSPTSTTNCGSTRSPVRPGRGGARRALGSRGSWAGGKRLVAHSPTAARRGKATLETNSKTVGTVPWRKSAWLRRDLCAGEMWGPLHEGIPALSV